MGGSQLQVTGGWWVGESTDLSLNLLFSLESGCMFNVGGLVMPHVCMACMEGYCASSSCCSLLVDMLLMKRG